MPFCHSRSHGPRATGAAALAAMVLGSAVAAAQLVDPGVEKLYNQALAEMADKKYSDACPRLEAVTRQVPDGLGAKITLGECYEGAGRLGSANAQYTLVLRAATATGNAERGKEANKKISALAPRVARLTVRVAEGARSLSGFVVTLDGVVVPAAEWGQGLPVDTGSHQIRAAALGSKTWSKQVDVASDGEKLTVDVPSLVEGEPEPPPSTGVTARFAGGIAAVGGGVLGLALGAVSSAVVSDAQRTIEPYRSAVGRGEGLCAATRDNPDRFSASAAILDACGKAVFGPLQFISYGAGLALGGAGAYLLVTSGRAPAKTALSIAPIAGPGLYGLAAAGTF